MTKHVCIRMLMMMVFIHLTGCSGPPPNDEQENFVRSYRVLKNDLQSLKIDKMIGLFGNRLLPENISQTIDEKQKELDALLHNKDRSASSWRAEVDGIYREGSDVVITASYEGIFFRMTIFNETAKKIAEGIKAGDQIVFSGILGSEVSLTDFGASLAPEFCFYPSEIRWKSMVLNQPILTKTI